MEASRIKLSDKTLSSYTNIWVGMCVDKRYEQMFIMDYRTGGLIERNPRELSKLFSTVALYRDKTRFIGRRRVASGGFPRLYGGIIVISDNMEDQYRIKVGNIITHEAFIDMGSGLADVAYMLSKRSDGKYDMQKLAGVRPTYIMDGNKYRSYSEWGSKHGIIKNTVEIDGEQDSYSREQDSYSREQDSYSREQDSYSREQDSYSREQDSYSREQDSYEDVTKKIITNNGNIRGGIDEDGGSVVEIIETPENPVEEDTEIEEEQDYNENNTEKIEESIMKIDEQIQEDGAIHEGVEQTGSVDANDFYAGLISEDDEKEDEPEEDEVELPKHTYNPDCTICGGKGTYVGKFGGTFQCQCYVNYEDMLERVKRAKDKVNIEHEKSKTSSLKGLGIIPDEYLDVEFNGEDRKIQLDKVGNKRNILDSYLSINATVRKSDAEEAFDIDSSKAEQELVAFKSSPEINNFVEDKTFEELTESLRASLETRQETKVYGDVDLAEFYYPLVALNRTNDLQLCKTPNRQSSPIKVRLNNYESVYVTLANTLLDSCRNGRKLTNSYLIGGDKGFGKKDIAYQCMRYLHCNNKEIVPYLSLTELEEYLYRYNYKITPKMASEESNMNMFMVGKTYEDSNYGFEKKTFEWGDFMNVPVLFTFISGTANLRKETELLYQILNIRGAKCLPTIVFTDHSIKFLQTDIVLNSYYWRNMINSSETDKVYDRMVYKSSYWDIIQDKPYKLILRNKSKGTIVGEYIDSKLVYVQDDDAIMFTNGVIKLRKKSDKYVSPGKDI